MTEIRRRPCAKDIDKYEKDMNLRAIGFSGR